MKSKTILKKTFLENSRFGRNKRLAGILDSRKPNQGIKLDFDIRELFVGKTVVVSPHFDDSSLNYGGALARFSKAGGEAHVVNVSPGHKTPIKGFKDSDAIGKTLHRLAESKKEARILRTETHFLDLRALYEKRRIIAGEARKFYRKLDELNPTTLVIPGPFDTHSDHQNSRILALNWAASKAMKGKPVVIVEAPSMWGSVPENLLTHALEMDSQTFRQRQRAQKAHASQMQRTAFHEASSLQARARGITLGEVKYGLMARTPKLGPTEVYSQHVLAKEGRKLVFKRLGAETLRELQKE